MDRRGSGDNGSVTSTAKGSSSRQGGMERCCQSRHQGTSASWWNKVRTFAFAKLVILSLGFPKPQPAICN